MKRFMRCFFMALLMFGGAIFICANSTCVQASPNTPYMKFGDVNFDGAINEQDTEIVQQHIAASKSDDVYTKHPDWYLQGKASKAADVNEDGKVDTTDLLHIQRHRSMKKGDSYVSHIVTVTLMNEEKTIVYDCFPVIYYWKDTSNNRYPYLYKLSKSGYNFKGWYLNGSSYGSKAESYGLLADMDDHILYARWEAKPYYLYFDANGGSCSTLYYTLSCGTSYGTLPTPTRNGYTFTGWYTKKSGGSKVSSSTKMTSGNVTVYAHWKVSTKIALNKTSVTLRPKQTYQLRATVTGKQGSLKWTSSNSKVASVSSTGKVTAKKAGTANITATVNGCKKVCKVTVVNPAASTVSFQSLKGKNYSYKNSKYSFGIGFAKSTDYVYIGVWNLSGTSSSYEDFCFEIKEGTYNYRQKGMRSYYIYDITIKPYQDYVKVSLKCENSSYNYFNISGQNFKKTTNTTCSDYAEFWSTVEIKNYLYGAGTSNTVRYAQQLADAVGGMKQGQNAKYPDLYCTGNNMVIGVNNRPVFQTSKDEYVRIENNGNEAVFFYGVKIGDTKKTMEEKFSKYNIRTWDNGKTYSNANGWEVQVTFVNGKLTRYIYLCRPTS